MFFLVKTSVIKMWYDIVGSRYKNKEYSLINPPPPFLKCNVNIIFTHCSAFGYICAILIVASAT